MRLCNQLSAQKSRNEQFLLEPCNGFLSFEQHLPATNTIFVELYDSKSDLQMISVEPEWKAQITREASVINQRSNNKANPDWLSRVFDTGCLSGFLICLRQSLRAC